MFGPNYPVTNGISFDRGHALLGSVDGFLHHQVVSRTPCW